MSIEIEVVPCLKDNYAYLVKSGRQCAVVDPSEAEPVQQTLAQKGWKLTHILNTHHHLDHCGGNLDLKQAKFTRSRPYRKNDNAHCEQKNWTHVRQLFGHERFEHPELVPLMNDLYALEWSQYTNHFKPTFKLLDRQKKDGKIKRIYENQPQTPYQRLLASAEIPEATKTRLRAEHAKLDPFALKKSIEAKLKKFFTVLGNLNYEATKT